jgi:cytochrome c oxidase subunit 2
VKPNRIATFLIVGAVFVVVGILVGLTARVFPTQASAEATNVDSLFNFMLAIAVVVFLIVEGGIIYSIIRFRKKPGDESDGTPIHGNTTLEIIWTAIPAIVVVVLAVYSYQVFAQTQTPQENQLVIGVIGQQFQWKFTYPLPPDPDPNVTAAMRDKIKTYMITSELHLPVGRPVRVDIESRDVIHGFFIPEFRIKQDAIPGRVSYAYFTPTATGEWAVECTVLCGVGHGNMSQINRVIVQEPAEYDKYVAALYGNAKTILNDPRSPAVGKELFVQKYPCATCHTLTDAGTTGKIGPSLDGVGTRAGDHAQKAEGLIGGTDAAAYLRGSIVNPNQYIVEGFQPNIMPQTFGDPKVMPTDDLEAIVNYLLTQK